MGRPSVCVHAITVLSWITVACHGLGRTRQELRPVSVLKTGQDWKLQFQGFTRAGQMLQWGFGRQNTDFALS
jgi:hypothetical protein